MGWNWPCLCELSMARTRHAFRNDTHLSLREVRDEAIPTSNIINDSLLDNKAILKVSGDCFDRAKKTLPCLAMTVAPKVEMHPALRNFAGFFANTNEAANLWKLAYNGGQRKDQIWRTNKQQRNKLILKARFFEL